MEAKILILVLVSFSLAISVVAENVNTDLDSSVSVEKKDTKLPGEEVDRNKVGLNSGKVDQEENGGNQINLPKKGVQSSVDSTSDSSSLSDSVKEHTSQKKVDDLSDKGKDNTGGKGEEKPDNGLKQKERTKDVKNDADSSTRKDASESEECDESNMCKFEGDALIACLRVPGDESPDLSLLIQNKGKKPSTITISGPEFVHIERTPVQLQPGGNDKVKVSISDGGRNGNGDSIVLNSGKSRCNLDFRNLITQNAEKGNHYNPLETTYFSYLRRSPIIAVVAFASILTAAAACTCIIVRKKHFSIRSYQRLDMELPISIGDKSVLQANDGWDNSWDDDWGNDEAPMTPSTAVTPSFSSPGLASRRLNKDGWKD